MSAFLYAGLIAAGLSAPADATTYNVDVVSGTDSIVGTISTDGATGTLAAADITGVDVVVSPNNGSSNYTIDIGAGCTFPTSCISVGGSSLQATATTLSFEFETTTFAALQVTSFFLGPYFDLEDSAYAAGGQVVVSGGIGGTTTDEPAPSSDVIGVAATPLPAALPLFAGGLGALGLFGWRRKKKSATLAA